ncbi:hypothetical protein [Pseudarthrobacter polychromogenes]|uniref:Uncharacterized protein n=1 Tax=Pseudarthrobacter polychromogenes TaxID=1676 RepID=A0ABQ1Y3M0_9MICC|nr:hypothetical protein [Pseudarthrobacter polychromogenes]GGH10536.1 hypothetical protein GCM10011577_39380 [Pseudarthrobacter polychromogenes]
MATRDVPTLDSSGRMYAKHLPQRVAEATQFQGYIDPLNRDVLQLSYYDTNAADLVGDTVLADIPAVDPAQAVLTSLRTVVLKDGKVPAAVLPAVTGGTGGSVSGTSRKDLVLGAGFTKPSWGRQPSFTVLLGEAHLAGHLAPGTSDFIVGAVIATGGTWAAGIKAIAATDTGRVLLRSTATTLEIDSILTGSAPAWLSLDGVIV